jgi:hypothetical protein
MKTKSHLLYVYKLLFWAEQNAGNVSARAPLSRYFQNAPPQQQTTSESFESRPARANGRGLLITDEEFLVDFAYRNVAVKLGI